MMKMIIADDETIITAGIRKLVDWEAMGIEIVGVYPDGKSALEGMMIHKPDIALLDISMPEMTGVDVLKECNLLGMASKIILISGFQDFEYAKAAIRYGAVDYLLKPVIRDELLNAIGKSLNQLKPKLRAAEGSVEGQMEEYAGLLPLNEGTYLPSYAEIFWEKEEEPQMKKLVRFSVVRFIEEYLEERNQGIVFMKQEDIVIIWKKMGRDEGKAAAKELILKVYGQLGYHMGAVVGKAVEKMSQIPEAFQRCLCMKGYFFFADQLQSPVLSEGEKVFPPSGGNSCLLQKRGQMIDMVIAQDEENTAKYFGQFAKAVCNAADGKKEDAIFYLCSAIRVLDEKFRNLALPGAGYDEKELLQKGRECRNYRELQRVFYTLIREYLEKLKALIVNNNNRDFLKAKAYIDNHYDENLTLDVLAGEIHMNSYYFSTFFKKNAGENFKDYVSRIRIQHALSLLVSTDLKVYEIALKVGFSDARAFSDNFQRIYHETPASYRRRTKQQK